MRKRILFAAGLISSVCAAQQPQIIHTLQVPAGENSPLIADVNSDGAADLLLVSENDGHLNVWLGDGDMGFAPVQRFFVGNAPTALSVADVDADGHQDVVVANHERQFVSLLPGQGNGQFDQLQRKTLSTLPHPHVAMVADINADGHVDIVVDSRDQSGLVVLPGTGSGDFKSPGTLIPVAGAPYLGFALGDINRDGQVDIVTPNANAISVLLHAKDMQFTPIQSIRMPAVFAVALADLNGDENLDLIAASNNGAIHVYVGTGTGQFSPEPTGQVHIGTGAKLISTGDFDGDGVDDAVISNWNGGIHVLRFANQTTLEHLPLVTGQVTVPWGLAAGDLNGDGRDEIVVTDGTGSVLQIYGVLQPDR